METLYGHRYIDRENSKIISLGCIVASLTFFLVLSQFLILRVPEIVTNLFRPVVIIVLFFEMHKRGEIRGRARNVALIAALYLIFLIPFLGYFNADELKDGIGRVLYLLMFFFIVGTPWTKKEIRFMLTAVYLGCFACTVVFMLSNNMTDYSQSEGIELLGITVNRNKNAYAFAIGSALGLFYFIKNRGFVRLLVLFMTAMIGYCLLYSQCRGAFFCAVLAMAWFVLGDLRGLRKSGNSHYLFALVMFVLFCIVSYYLIKNSELSRLVDTDSTSGRDEGIEYALDLFRESDTFSKVFGHGYLFEAENTEGAISHSVFTNYLLSTGVIGSALITLIFILSFLEVRGQTAYALLLMATLRVFFELMDYYIYVPLILAFVIFRYSRGDIKKESNLFRDWLRRPRTYRR